MNDSIIIVASGPSLTTEQVEQAKASHLPIMVVNDNYKLVPNADYLFAADLIWWYNHYDKVPEEIQCYTLEGHPLHLSKRIDGAYERLKGIDYTRDYGIYDDKLYLGGNSGFMALQLAKILGYTRLILIGYDCQHTGEKKHWFGDHDRKRFRKNAEDVELWQKEFDSYAPFFSRTGIEVINCSAETALTCFKRDSLEAALG